MSFCSLHIHTEYSSLDGMIRIPSLFEKALEYKYPAVAITDHGTLAGIYEAYEEACKNDLKFIVGIEAYQVSDVNLKSRSSEDRTHLVLLAKNEVGYKNLLALNYEAYKNFYVRPRIDWKMLETMDMTGIICSTACMSGRIPKILLKTGDFDRAEEEYRRYEKIFKDGIFIEVQSEKFAEQQKMNELMFLFANRVKAMVVATTDSHYLCPEDEHTHKLLLAIQSKKSMDDPDVFKFDADPLRSEEYMLDRFSTHKSAVHNSVEIANQCQDAREYLVPPKDWQLPRFNVEGATDYKEFEKWKLKLTQTH